IESRSFPLAPPFLAVATQNPIEQEGTYPLPEAQLDRFLLKVLMNYPTPEDVLAMQQGTALVRVDPVVLDYAVRVTRATREWPGIAMGAGPRGSLALVRAARAQAVLDGRDF